MTVPSARAAGRVRLRKVERALEGVPDGLARALRSAQENAEGWRWAWGTLSDGEELAACIDPDLDVTASRDGEELDLHSPLVHAAHWESERGVE